MFKKGAYLLFATLLLGLMLFLSIPGRAQSYYFQLPEKVVDVYWQEDGTLSLQYVYSFNNDPQGSPIEYVDVPMPNPNFDAGTIQADVNGRALTDISESGYLGTGTGVAVGLGVYAIPPGQSGIVTVTIGRIWDVLYFDSDDQGYASAVFVPNYFDSSIVYGNTKTTVIFHLPPGVQPEEPRWHAAPSGFNDPPLTGFDQDGRITYTWTNETANGSEAYTFGASFPSSYVPETTIQRANPFAWLANINLEFLFPLICIGFFVLIFYWVGKADRSRKLKYLPPQISIEGHGIKRGLTAVEAAILLEQPMEKILTMILFAVIKKGAAEVVKRDPLEVKAIDPMPEDLRSYEVGFVNAFKVPQPSSRQRELKNMVVDLVKKVALDMKGFSRRETIEYYRSITQKAWEQVEAAQTPEVKSQKFDEVMEWTMLDKEYDDRTKRVFQDTPIFIPRWWGHFDPSYGGASFPARPVSTGTGAPAGGPVSMPHLPGSDFAASVVNQVQSFSSKVVGNITDFTNSVTSTTNPVPKSTSSSSYRGGGRSGGSSCACACACACAGCACACAGGGR
jgi:hypothetical protein